MPKWGLTAEQAASEPWGIPSRWLEPSKTITDPIHGDIFVNVLEATFLDSSALQRLRRVRQLGTTHLVYPGATHSRLSHSLGALRAAQDLLDAVIDNRRGPRPADDLFSEWSSRIPRNQTLSQLDKELAKVTVLARLGALLHDVTHVPFGHTIEDDLGVLRSHDHNEPRYEAIWSSLPRELADLFASADPAFAEQLKMLIVSKPGDDDAPWPQDDYVYPFVADIVGNTICADLMDYLARDHAFCGLPIAIGRRFMHDFYVSSSNERYFPKRMVIRVTRDGHDRHDVVTELVKYLRFRYELSERALTHHAKLAADAMIGKLLEMWADAVWVDVVGRHDPRTAAAHPNDGNALREAVRLEGAEIFEERLAEVRAVLEAKFLAFGDDGLLESLRDWGQGAGGDKRRQAVGDLADDVLNRQLYRRIGRADAKEDQALAKRVFDQFGKPDKRRQVERRAAEWAEVPEAWRVAVWLPSPKMRLKVAGVLVDQNGHVNELDKAINLRVSDIYRSHESLWGVTVFGHPELDDATERRLLSSLGEQLGLRFMDRSGKPVPWPVDLVLAEIDAYLQLDDSIQTETRRRLRQDVAAHKGRGATYSDLLRRAELLVESDEHAPGS
ncbi:MAG: superfamily phosphohydrolase [Acidimicrobiales bacterium]|nr:superfamily phosphohydrolase [Acidimicrobiales bacterium]